jgi:hypothetical protein
MQPMSPLSPTLSLRDVQESEASQFPMTNIDNPSDIAQELSNLQALRRMSMDVGNHMDPDLPPFQGMSLMAMPSVAPTGEDDEGDISRLLWVPAKVHPELAPDQFKNFLENRVQSMKRRSGESMLSVDGLQRNNSGSLRRKKSMLSRQIDNTGGRGADGYLDGAERLERKGSITAPGAPELSLNELVKDPSKVVEKLTLEAQRLQEGGAERSSMEDDMPILPVAPGMGLRRSTRTTYRKGGSLRAGDRLPFSKRLAARQAEKEAADDESPRSSRSSEFEAPKGHALQRVQSEPVAENFSRPSRSVRRRQPFESASASSSPIDSPVSLDSPDTPTASPSQLSHELHYRSTSSESRPLPSAVPTIVATPPAEEHIEPQRPFPQRSSSQKAAQHMYQQQQQVPTIDEPPPRSNKRPSLGRPSTSPSASPVSMDPNPPSPSQQLNQTLNDMAQHPSPLPGSGSTRTDSLTFIPTLPAEEKKLDKKDSEGGKSSGWKWFKSDDKDKKKKDKDELSKKSRGWNLVQEKVQEKVHDNARLDVLQNSIDHAVAKGRESLLLDRDSVDNKLQEERKKESSRKTGEAKKEKDGFFGSFFSGSRKKEGKESGGKTKQSALSPEIPVRPLRPDVDYPYTRFPIVEERAIYRMAHIKLANPRRDLRSQVLLSNFMYSYLAKVQAMHPQLNVPISPQQKRQEEERKRKEQEQQYLEQQMMMQQQQQDHESDQDNIDQFNFEYHRVSAVTRPTGQRLLLTIVSQSANQYGDSGQPHDDGVEYAESSQMYEYDHGEHASQQNGGYDHNGQTTHGRSRSRNYHEYEQQHQQHDGGRREDDGW